MKQLKKIFSILMIFILSLSIVPSIYVKEINANTELFVELKEEITIYTDQEVNINMFNIKFGEEIITNTDNITISPTKFTTCGTQPLVITYKDGDTTYMKKIMINVSEVKETFLSYNKDIITLISNQNITKENLPDIYLNYNNGDKKIITDYNFEVDWGKKIVTILYEKFELMIPIEVIENEMDHLEVLCLLENIPENYEFKSSDIEVIVHYTNGTKEKVSDYEVLPYKLIEGSESLIYVSYKNVIGYFKVLATKPIEQTIFTPTTPTETPTQQPDIFPIIPTKTPLDQPTNKPNLTTPLDPTKIPSEQPVKIDKTAPQTTILSKTYTKNVKIYATDESGIKSIILQGSLNKSIKNGYKLTKEGSYRLIITDNYGNVTKVNFKLKKPAKKITLTYSFTNKWDIINFAAEVTGTTRAVRWSTSNKKIATINQKGKFKAKKSGIVYVIVKIDRKQVKQKIKVSKATKSILLY